MTTEYVMRGLQISTGKHVYWTSGGNPDFTGQFAPVPPSDLNLGTIAVDYTTTTPVGSTGTPAVGAGGDLTGAYPNPTVAKIQGTSVSSTPPVANQILIFDGTKYVPAGNFPVSPAVTQTDWYVDWVSGNDSNDGKTPATAVKTIMGGIVPKWGTRSPVLNQNTTIHILSSQPYNAEEIFIAPVTGGKYWFAIVGTPTVVVSGTLGTVTAKNRATNQPLVVDLGAAAASATRGMAVQNTTRSSFAWIRSIVGTLATLTQPHSTKSPGDPVIPGPLEDNGWVTGNSFQIQTLPALNLVDMEAIGGAVASDNSSGLWLKRLRILDASGGPGISGFQPIARASYTQVIECVVEPYMVLALPTFGYASNCWLEGGLEMYSDCAVVGGIATSTAIVAIVGAGSVAANDFVLETSGEGNGTCTFGEVEIDAAGFLDIAGVGVYLGIAQAGGTSCIWGAGLLNVISGGVLTKGIGNTWVQTLPVANLQLDSGTTATAYSAGTWTGGITLTAAHLDGYGGLQNPITGSRYAP